MGLVLRARGSAKLEYVVFSTVHDTLSLSNVHFQVGHAADSGHFSSQ
jgi:hypothetical protein